MLKALVFLGLLATCLAVYAAPVVSSYGVAPAYTGLGLDYGYGLGYGHDLGYGLGGFGYGYPYGGYGYGGYYLKK
ncbi:keratin-associated protein 19-2-like [Ornithodoros turicata]|uniref:keratin-associated protein 19-2-like n=1 Tax=Ornithodoros turicata TaxID=34597 RepID=UPI0031397E86